MKANRSSKNQSWKENSLFPYWNLPKNKNLIQKARALRKAGVISEVIFWKTFKNKELTRWDIDRQIIIGNYIVDFFIPELGLVFEIDGNSHDFKPEYDSEREDFLISHGLRVVHLKDTDVKIDLEYVKNMVLYEIEKRVTELSD